MSDFKFGDKISIAAVGADSYAVEAWVVPSNDDIATAKKVTVNPQDQRQASYDLASVLGDDRFQVTRVASLEEQLPSEPGRYLVVPGETIPMLKLLGYDRDNPHTLELMNEIFGEDQVANNGIWTLNEDGTWTDPHGETRSKEWNCILVITEDDFVRVD